MGSRDCHGQRIRRLDATILKRPSVHPWRASQCWLLARLPGQKLVFQPILVKGQPRVAVSPYIDQQGPNAPHLASRSLVVVNNLRPCSPPNS